MEVGRGPRAWHVAVITLVLAVVGFVLRWYHVGRSIHQDSLLWFVRAQSFWKALARHDWDGTYQAPHPGVPMMWIAGAWLKIEGLLSSEINPRGVLAVKLPGAVMGTLAAASTFPLLLALLGKSQWRPALVMSVLLTTEPVLVQESRLGHLDMTSVGFAWVGMLVALLAYERERKLALVAGACFGFAALTRFSLAVLPATLLVLSFGMSAATKFRDRRGAWVSMLAGTSTLVIVYAFWPAMWSHPIDTMREAFSKSGDMMGRARHVSAPELYGKFLLGRLTPEALLLSILGLSVAWLPFARPLRRSFALLALSMVPYLVVMMLTPKKSVRYALPAIPVVLLLATLGFEWLAQRAGKWRRATTLGLASVLGLLSVGRVAHAAVLLPASSQCTPWPGVECGRPDRMYFVRDVGRAIREDWRKRGERGRPRVYGGGARLMAPWVRLQVVGRGQEADYLVIWDSELDDAEKGTLGRKARREFSARGAEVAVIRDEGAVVARVYRHR